ncbi:hypothetical protein NADFUDRAFT_66367 [Nadsonia fulvescens var. elongata DSM 6958]|uniref:Zinc finger CCCH domain-containing protein 15 n=1 Tax=Nadsonia fulvescens var. elongata DSM 6958 TaxID=857566 RepID=A0A1E3PIN7_9ASCO|nr:hypothetical protein NADFUDRAFT_66367 [Nadsonia fulvescens var. elongata DSM 6958]
MPPKQKLNEKNKAAKRNQSTADKTFGLKNKNKSSKVQKFVAQVEAQNASTNNRKKEFEARKLAEKRASELAKVEALKLLKPVVQQKIPFGVDPKSVVCAYFKAGQCTKGARCKFSHDLEIERKGAKKDLYTDARKEDDTMDKWDDEKLKSVVLSKQGNAKTTTDIICKYFIESVENGKYGWFWVCPGGGDECKYKHSLPQGFKLKTKEQLRTERQAAANAPKFTLEEFLETERHKLGKGGTLVTLESFNQWKKEKEVEKAKKAQEDLANAKKNKTLSGKQLLDSGKYVPDDEEDDGADTFDMEILRQRVEEIDRSNDDLSGVQNNTEYAE